MSELSLGQIATGIALISSIVGGVYLIEDRYQKQQDAICQVEKNNLYIEQTVNTVRIEIFTQELMKTSPGEQAVLMKDIQALQKRQSALAAQITSAC